MTGLISSICEVINLQGKVHVAIGVGALACLCVKYPSGFDFNGINILPIISMATAAAGSYAPDIDSNRTHAGQKHKVASSVVSKVGGGHRGITHTLLFPAIIAGFMIFVNGYLAQYQYLATLVQSLLFGFEFGWVMHIFADLFNGKGCPVFWPIVQAKVHIMDLPSSGFVPWIFAAVLIAICAFFTLGGLF